jgi:tetratricopeptide (TPR) repeat protein
MHAYRSFAVTYAGACKLTRMFRFRLLGSIVVGLFAVACHSSPRVVAPSAPKLSARVAVAEISDEQFGKLVVSVLGSSEKGGQRSSQLASVVRHQLRRADALLRRGERDAGRRAVRGALWLVRAGEERPEMWQGAAGPLSNAAEEAARVGDEGKARALYSLVKQAGPAPAMAAAVDEHVEAMERFATVDATRQVLEVAGDQQRVAVQRSLYEPSIVNLEAAGRSLVDWMRKSLQSDVLERWGDPSFDREEAIEAFRARRFGAMTMVGVFLRHGAPMGALDWLEQNDLGRLLPSDVRDRLEQAGEDYDPKAWHLLYQHFQNESEPSRADSSVGVELAEAAAFGTAVELYRSRPTSLASAGPLALLLPDLMLGDVVPPLVASAFSDTSPREDASFSMALIMRAMLAHGSVGDIEVARRLFADSRPLLDRATRLVKTGEALRPHPARLYAVMASLESRNTNLERARESLQQALALEPEALAYLELARIERQLDQAEAAQKAVLASLVLARRASDLLAETDAQLLLFELESERGKGAAGQAALREALRMVLRARDRAHQPEEYAQAERRLARILELYGEYEGSKRASQRALDASRNNHQQRTATILDAARRALTFRDLRAAREALKDALDSGISGADCVYVALWVRLLERQLRVPSDGSVEEALSRVGEVAPWPGSLRSWALGNLSDTETQQLARTEAEKTELKFCQALAVRGAQSSEASRRAIAEVAHSRAVGLIEVSVARDLLRLAEPSGQPRWPEEVSIP